MDHNKNDEFYGQQYTNEHLDNLLLNGYTFAGNDAYQQNQQQQVPPQQQQQQQPQQQPQPNANPQQILSTQIPMDHEYTDFTIDVNTFNGAGGGSDGFVGQQQQQQQHQQNQDFLTSPSVDNQALRPQHHRSNSSHSDTSSMVPSPHLSAAHTPSPYQSTFSSPYLNATTPQDTNVIPTITTTNGMLDPNMMNLEQQMTSNFTLLDNSGYMENPTINVDYAKDAYAPQQQVEQLQQQPQQAPPPQQVSPSTASPHSPQSVSLSLSPSPSPSDTELDNSFLQFNNSSNNNLLPPPRSNRQRSQSDSNLRQDQQQQQQQQHYQQSQQAQSPSSADFLSPESAESSSGNARTSRRSRSASTSSSKSRSRSRSRSRSASRDYILELAAPTQNNKRVQKHPSAFACTLCDKRFTRAYNLRSHLRTHTDERPFVCTVCGKAFARQHDRKRHEALHSGEKKFECKGVLADGKTTWGCGRKFARADALGRHFRTEAGRECIKPLLEEEKREQTNNPGAYPQGQDQSNVPIYVGGDETPSLMLSPPGGEAQPSAPQQQPPPPASQFFPSALLQQFPSLLKIDQSMSPISGSDHSDGDEGDGYLSGQ